MLGATDSGGVEPLTTLACGPATWLRGQVREMLTLLGIPLPDPETIPQHLPALPAPPSPEQVANNMDPSGKNVGSAEVVIDDGATGTNRADSPGRSPGRDKNRLPLYSARGSARYRALESQREALKSARPLTGTARMKFHFFSFQIHGTTGYKGFS